MKATGTFVQVKCDDKPKGFVSVETVMREGKVISVGEDAKNIKVGDIVLFSKESHVIEHTIKSQVNFFVDYKSIVAIS